MAAKLKNEQIEKILSSVIQLEVNKGHLRWRMADLSRTSDVTRSLIYYYFGKDKKALFKQAVYYYADVFFDFRMERAQKIKRGEIVDLISIARKRFKDNPHFLQFYAKYRMKDGDITQTFHKAEKQYFENLKETLPTKHRQYARVLWALIFGLAIQPGISEDDLKFAETFLRKIW